MTPPFVLSGHGMDPKLTPVYRRSAGAIEISTDIDNSSVQGILTFGPNAFPVESACTPGHIKLWRRDAAGDTLLLDDIYDPTESNTSGVYVWRVAGVNFDLGSSGYVNDGDPTGFPGSSCTGECNHGRWVTSAGIARTVQRTTRIQFVTDLCPGTVLYFDQTYNITANFTG